MPPSDTAKQTSNHGNMDSTVEALTTGPTASQSSNIPSPQVDSPAPSSMLVPMGTTDAVHTIPTAHWREEYLLHQFATWAPVDEIREVLTLLQAEKESTIAVYVPCEYYLLLIVQHASSRLISLLIFDWCVPTFI